MTAIKGQQLREKLLKEKKNGMKKTIKMMKQNTYERTTTNTQYRKHRYPTKKKEIKEEPIQKG